MTRSAKPPKLKPRQADSHKGTYGRVLIVAGSRQMPGAAALAAMGALRGGAGLVTVATPESALPLIAPAVTCATYLPLPESPRGFLAPAARRLVLERAEAADSVVLGPGLGVERGTVSTVRKLVAAIRKPLLLDADGLNAIAAEPQVLLARAAATVLTPHPGELMRLDLQPLPRGREERRRRAEQAASRFRAVICLKGHETVVTDGAATYVNDTGNPGMASGGTGDVLAGLAGTFLAQIESPLDAAIAAVRLHGLAGDVAARCRGQAALIASDLLEALGEAFARYSRKR
ncbi:MAG: NAD(P)H-hydrate dehydratase [Planctomycetes bacterium]|nr:NAD(P)H-hydrate dehydratase [Planctomycetota bacterium]